MNHGILTLSTRACVRAFCRYEILTVVNVPQSDNDDVIDTRLTDVISSDARVILLYASLSVSQIGHLNLSTHTLNFYLLGSVSVLIIRQISAAFHLLYLQDSVVTCYGMVGNIRQGYCYN